MTRSRRDAPRTASYRPQFETLESRLLLTADPVVDFTPTPAGQLDGKIVYTSAGHGWQWSDTLNRWATDRGDNEEIVEDFGNQDQLTFFADYLLRAGATVVPMRPVGHQLNEVVLDNDSPGVTFSGSWTNSSSRVYYDEDYGESADTIPYRFANASSGSETATATYEPDIPEAGFYPIYTWVLDGENRVDQLYRIEHSGGGVTEIRVDHSMVGKGWVYLGTYHFDEGTSGRVVISNESPDAGVVIADAIRFGNGMGDLKDGPGGVGAESGIVSGYPREDENSLMWLWRSIGVGTDPASVIGTGNVSAPQRMAEHMNANTNAFGDSVYIGFHSNAGGGRGAVGLIHSTASSQTPNQAALALYTARQINQDMQALNGVFEHNWSTRTTHTYSSVFGEIDGTASAEMDQTIIEVAFHDDEFDAELMRDPKVRDQLARSTYEAVLEYFDNFGGLSTPVSQPSAPSGVAATTDAAGNITVSWTPGPTGVPGGAPTDYRVYASRDGYGYFGYVSVPAGGTNSYTFSTLDLDDDAYYFKVVAVNAGGESPSSAVTSARHSGVNTSRVLIVDGFDRNDRFLNERYAYAFASDGLTDRVRTRYNNSFDYVVQYGDALTDQVTHIDTAQNEVVIAGGVSLDDYDMVFWFTGEESTADDTFDAVEQTLVNAFLARGGKLLVSGAEIGWDLDRQGNGVSFYNNQLKADYVLDDANTYSVQGAAGSIFSGLSFDFDDGDLFYDVTFPDVISPLGGAVAAASYVGGTGGVAAIQYSSGGEGRLVNLGFPLETITSPSDRQDVVERVFDFFGGGPPLPGDYDADGDVDGDDYSVWQSTFGSTADLRADGNNDLIVNAADYTVWRDNLGAVAAVSSFDSSEPTAAAAVTAPSAVASTPDGATEWIHWTAGRSSYGPPAPASSPAPSAQDSTVPAVDAAFLELWRIQRLEKADKLSPLAERSHNESGRRDERLDPSGAEHVSPALPSLNFRGRFE